jgi:hypothetical protein
MALKITFFCEKCVILGFYAASCGNFLTDVSVKYYGLIPKIQELKKRKAQFSATSRRKPEMTNILLYSLLAINKTY